MNILHKLITPSNNHSQQKMEVIYLPTSIVKSLLQACHDDPMTGAPFLFRSNLREDKTALLVA